MSNFGWLLERRDYMEGHLLAGKDLIKWAILPLKSEDDPKTCIFPVRLSLSAIKAFDLRHIWLSHGLFILVSSPNCSERLTVKPQRCHSE
jgi:hypothetical protein